MIPSAKPVWNLITERNSLRGVLLRGVIGSGGINALSMLFRVIVSIVLAQQLGAQGLGTYSFIYAVVGLLAIPVQLGFPQFVVRYFALYLRRQSLGLMKGLLSSVSLIVVAMAILTIVVSLPIARHFMTYSTFETFTWALTLLPLGGMLAIGASALRGLGFVTVGQFVAQVVQPFGLIVIIGTIVLTGSSLDATLAMKCNVLAVTLACMVAVGSLYYAQPPSFSTSMPEYKMREWIRGAFPFVVLTGTTIAMEQVDLVVLGVLATPQDVGVFSVVSRIGIFVPIGLLVINPVIAPQLARLHDAGNYLTVQRVISYSARASLAVALVLGTLLAVFGDWILGTMYGTEFAYGYSALMIILIGHIFSAAMGSVGLLLNMTGHAWSSALGLGLGTGVNLILDIVLIPRYGIEGAAVATVAGICVWKTVLAVAVYRRLGVIGTGLYVKTP